jgi:integrase
VRYVSEYLPAQGYNPKSIATRLGALSSLWVFLHQQLAAPLGRNPWQGHRVSSQKQKDGPRSRKSPEDERAFTEAELVALLHGTDRSRKWQVYPRVRDLLLLGLYTGARLNELCSLLVKDVIITKEARESSALLLIREGKTAADTRTLAVTHWAALQMLQRRIEGKEPTTQLLEELTPGGPDGKLSWTGIQGLHEVQA